MGGGVGGVGEIGVLTGSRRNSLKFAGPQPSAGGGRSTSESKDKLMRQPSSNSGFGGIPTLPTY